MKKLFTITAAAACCLLAASCDSTVKKMEKPGYSGKELIGVIEITRDKESKEAFIEVGKKVGWTLYGGPSVEKIDLVNPIGEGSSGGRSRLDIPGNVRSYFQVVTPRGAAVMAERHLPMEGGYNFRDLGGYRTKDGRHVKWGKFIRSDDMHSLTDSDLEYLSSIPLVSIVDFRSGQEMRNQPDMVPSSVENIFAYSIDPGNVMSISDDMMKSAEEAAEVMAHMNTLLVTQPAVVAQYRKFFELLQSEENLPLLFHCSAGKDRTGMGAALILFALGVDEKTVKQDYIDSNIYLADKYDDYIKEHPILEPLMVVKPEYMQAGLDAIKKHYGSVEEFLTGTLGVDMEAFRDKYLD